VRDIEIYVSSSLNAIEEVPFSDSSWKKVMSYTMSEATGDGTYIGEMLTFSSVEQQVKWVGINILNSHNSTNGYTGISEIKLYATNGLTSIQPVHINKLVTAFVQNRTLFIQAVDEGCIHCSIYSAQGIKYYSENIGRSLFTLSTDVLPCGCYILHFTDGVVNQVIKLIV
jgi:hypothetical protein